MTEKHHPITPPLDLVAAWCRAADDNEPMFPQIAAKAAEWGADKELEACCEWLDTRTVTWLTKGFPAELRAARRPKPLSLKERSLKHLEVMERDRHYLPEILQDLRRALEQLDD